MRRVRFQVLMVAVAALAVPRAEAYYHYIHYLGGSQNTPVYEKFDLSALPGKTVTFLVMDSGPATYGTNDDFSSVLSQVRQAAIAWNSVDSSDLRVAFGGLESQGQTANTPGGDVVFTDLAPGVLGMGGVATASNPAIDSSGRAFFPVTRALIQLTNNTSQAPGPSYLESFFTTAVHEMGHALGLQHTWTSAAMSQDVIRNTSRARPLDADDRAGLSVLYGKTNWAAAYGSISGRVTANGQGVALASVVAIPPVGPAVSALTNPDGTYTISGLPANNYLLYVHPLPPDAVVANSNLGLRLPVDQNYQSLQPFGSAFRTIFFPGTNNLQQATSFSVTPGTTITGQNFSVTPQSAVSMYDMVTYSYNLARNASNSPAFVNGSSGQITVVAQSNYSTTPIPQAVTILGGFSTASQCQSASSIVVPCFLPYSNALAIYLNVPPVAATGPRHMMFTLPNGDLYVLPDAVTLAQRNPPAINALTPNGDGTVTVTGTNFGADSSVYFDGQPATVQTNDGRASLTVVPPPGYSGQNASVIVFNSDGQNSTFYQSQNPPAYTYPNTGTPQINLNSSSLPANASSLVDITAVNMQFVDGQVTVGFGTSDISVRRVWVVSPAHLIANVSVASGAALGISEVSVISGFQIAAQSGGFQTQAANPSLPLLAMPIANADPNQPIIYPGAAVTIYGSNLGTSPNAAQLTLNDQGVPILFLNSNQLNFVVPAGFPPGLAVLKLNNGSTSSLPIEIQIDSAPPAITQVTSALGQLLDTSHPASAGDILLATVSGVDGSVANNTARVLLTLSSVPMPVMKVTAVSGNTVQVAFLVSQSFGGFTAPVVVTVDGARSSPYNIIVR